MSGSVSRNAVVDLRRARRRRPPRRTATCARGRTAAITGLRALVTLELGRGPAEHLVHRLAALRVLGDHLGHDRLRVHLLCDRGGGPRGGPPCLPGGPRGG